jgi:hypothetical protein
MPFQRTQKGIQRGGYDRSDGQPAASRVLPEKLHRARRKFQGDRHRGLGNFYRPVELGSF